MQGSGSPEYTFHEAQPEISEVSAPLSEKHIVWQTVPRLADPAPSSHYPGSGTVDDPFVVDWEFGDPENPYNWPNRKKWTITAQVSCGHSVPSYH